MLNIMEAPISMMKFENIRILKEMRNSVNRQVNCETANIHKTVSAAVRQLEDIRYLQKMLRDVSFVEQQSESQQIALKEHRHW